MSDGRWFEFTVRVGPYGFWAGGKEEREARRLERALERLVTEGMLGTKTSKYVTVEKREVEKP